MSIFGAEVSLAGLLFGLLMLILSVGGLALAGVITFEIARGRGNQTDATNSTGNPGESKPFWNRPSTLIVIGIITAAVVYLNLEAAKAFFGWVGEINHFYWAGFIAFIIVLSFGAIKTHEKGDPKVVMKLFSITVTILITAFLIAQLADYILTPEISDQISGRTKGSIRQFAQDWLDGKVNFGLPDWNFRQWSIFILAATAVLALVFSKDARAALALPAVLLFVGFIVLSALGYVSPEKMWNSDSAASSITGSTQVGMFAEDLEGCRTADVDLRKTTSKEIPVCRVGSKKYHGNRLFNVKLRFGERLAIELPGFTPLNRGIKFLDEATGEVRKFVLTDFIEVLDSTEAPGLASDWRAIVVKPEAFKLFFKNSKLALKGQDDFLRMEFTSTP